ncbi:MAG: hypothetical protein RPT25_15105 [Cycloclasticus sp.]
MKREELSEITKAIEAASEKGITKALLRIGVDIANPIEVQKDLAFARKQREASEQITRFTKRTMLGLVIVGACSMLWAGFTDALHK